MTDSKRIIPLKLLCVSCFALSFCAYFADNALWCIGLFLAGLLVRIELVLIRQTKSQPAPISVSGELPLQESTLTSPISEDYSRGNEADENLYSLDLTDQQLESWFGWRKITLYPTRRQFETSICFGGPPSTEEIWEYQIRDRDIVICRLLDRFIDDLNEQYFEVVNREPQTLLFERRNNEWEKQERGPLDNAFGAPYSADQIRSTEQQTNGMNYMAQRASS